MSLRREQLFARVASEARALGNSYLIGDAQELSPLLDAAPELQNAAVAIVFARQITAEGRLVDPEFPTAEHPKLWAVLPDSTARTGETGIIDTQADVRGPLASRIFSPIAFMDVDPEAGLIITELAEGISAREVQAAIAPTLHVSSQLDEIRVDNTRADYNKS